ncbi:hypothetical protein BD770DRAFT_340485 [Pilaira anomala]|nr:hypothetical protein BD770DRAFT_340485 [Pilaira anomala]
MEKILSKILKARCPSASEARRKKNLHVGKASFEQVDCPLLLKSLCRQSKAAKQINAENYTEFNLEHGKLLNKDWLIYPQMRFVSSQLLAGAIVADGSEFISINMVEPYGRYTVDDAHHERRFSPETSTFPKDESSYDYIQVIDRLSIGRFIA